MCKENHEFIGVQLDNQDDLDNMPWMGSIRVQWWNEYNRSPKLHGQQSNGCSQRWQYSLGGFYRLYFKKPISKPKWSLGYEYSCIRYQQYTPPSNSHFIMSLWKVASWAVSVNVISKNHTNKNCIHLKHIFTGERPMQRTRNKIIYNNICTKWALYVCIVLASTFNTKCTNCVIYRSTAIQTPLIIPYKEILSQCSNFVWVYASQIDNCMPLGRNDNCMKAKHDTNVIDQSSYWYKQIEDE